MTQTFADIGINAQLLKGLDRLGFTEPTPVQAQIIPLMLEQERDMVGLAQTGTGKTAAFGLPMIQLINSGSKKTQGLILCPTRELCRQVASDLTDYSRFVSGLRVLAIYGGASMEQQIRELRRGVHIIVATPGRLKDLLSRGRVDISAVRYVVFDEADEMMQMGFQEELNAILAMTPPEKNSLFFSATMSMDVKKIASKYMDDPLEITVGKRNAGAENVSHDYYMVLGRNRYPALKRIVDNNPKMYGIVFCRTRRETQDVAEKLIGDGYNADSLHGELSQGQRDQVMRKFRAKSLQILVATDVAARGLDVNDLTHVINYNLPDDNAAYTHRSGRTGRAGSRGISIALVDPREQYRIRQIEQRIKKKFTLSNIPSGQEVCKTRLLSLVEEVIEAKVDSERIDPLFADVSEKLAHLSREELVKKFIALEFNRFLDYYANAPDLNVRPGQSRGNKRTGIKNKGNRGGRFTRIHLNVGRRNGIVPEQLIGRINESGAGDRIQIGKIEIMRNATMLEGDSRYISKILSAFQHYKVNGKVVVANVAPHGAGSGGGGHKGRRPGKFKKYKKQGGRST